MTHDFVILDVFSDQAFGGNQLAVIPNATGLSDSQMQNIAKEFNFAETAFVLPPANEQATRRLRIFTPVFELPFAGHPTVGTGAALVYLGEVPAPGGTALIVFEELIGLVDVTVNIGAISSVLWSELTSRHDVEVRDDQPDRDAIAAAIGLPTKTILDVWSASAGVGFSFCHLDSPESVDRACLDKSSWDVTLNQTWAPQIFLFSGDAADGGRLYARMFAPQLGIAEDAATGSACATLAGSLAQRARRPDASLTLEVTQGVLMGRPSRLVASAEKVGGAVQTITVSGKVNVFAQGQLRIG